MKLNSREIVKGRGGTSDLASHASPLRGQWGTQRAMSLPAGSYLSLSRTCLTGLVDTGHAEILGPAQLVLITEPEVREDFRGCEVGIWWRNI
jgi:hypothetical protein